MKNCIIQQKNPPKGTGSTLDMQKKSSMNVEAEQLEMNQNETQKENTFN